MTSTPFLLGVLVGAVGAWYLERRRNGGGGAPGVGGPGRRGATSHPHARFSGLGRFGY